MAVFVAPVPNVAVTSEARVGLTPGVNLTSEPGTLPHAVRNIDINTIKYGNRFSVIPPWFKNHFIIDEIGSRKSISSLLFFIK
jgi:hypothetical protein